MEFAVEQLYVVPLTVAVELTRRPSELKQIAEGPLIIVPFAELTAGPPCKKAEAIYAGRDASLGTMGNTWAYQLLPLIAGAAPRAGVALVNAKTTWRFRLRDSVCARRRAFCIASAVERISSS